MGSIWGRVTKLESSGGQQRSGEELAPLSRETGPLLRPALQVRTVCLSVVEVVPATVIDDARGHPGRPTPRALPHYA